MPGGGISGGKLMIFRTATTLLFIIPTAVGLWWLVFFTRKDLKGILSGSIDPRIAFERITCPYFQTSLPPDFRRLFTSQATQNPSTTADDLFGGPQGKSSHGQAD